MNAFLAAPTLRGWFSRVFSSRSRPSTRTAGQLAPSSSLAGALDDHGVLQSARTAATDGDPAAQNRLGLRLAVGDNGLRDEVEARKWLTEAAAQGHADAQFNLGNLCYSISLRDRDTPASGAGRIDAYVWYQLAAAQGHVRAAAACEMLNLQLSDTEVQDGDRRAGAFQRRTPALPEPKG